MTSPSDRAMSNNLLAATMNQQFLDDPALLARSWKSDFPSENGNYIRPCTTCGKDFIGHKRRITCFACAAAYLEHDKEG